MRVAVVPTGTANIASVLAAFRRLGASPGLVERAEQVWSAPYVVVPGVGSFGAAAAEIDRSGMREVLQRRVDAGGATLAICVGMQLLASTSEESNGVEGMGILPERLRRFPDDVRVPQMGWNRVEPGTGCHFVTGGWAYFANSFRLDAIPDGWAGAMSEHGGDFVAALERGRVLACQFHPELSGQWGAAVLSRWLDYGGAV